MNKEQPPVTEAELARVLELDAKATRGPFEAAFNKDTLATTDVTARDGEDWVADCGLLNGLNRAECEANAKLFAEYRTITPRLARELAAARAAIKVARDAIEEATRNGRKQGWNDHYPSTMEKLRAALAQLNTHTHE